MAYRLPGHLYLLVSIPSHDMSLAMAHKKKIHVLTELKKRKKEILPSLVTIRIKVQTKIATARF